MLFDEELLRLDFHMPGIEPWMAAVLKQHQLGLVLDVGVGMGFWGYLIKSYLTRGKLGNSTIVGMDLDKEKLGHLNEMKVYDELLCADVRHLPFRAKTFNTIIAVESLYINKLQDVLGNIEVLVENRGLIVFSRGLSKKARSELFEQGYDVYRVYLRGLMLTRLGDGKDFFAIRGVESIALALKLLYSVLRPKACDYVIALKYVDEKYAPR